MNTIDTIVAFLDQFAPADLAEEWDNVGLLVGDRRQGVERVMTCLTITPASAAEAIDRGAGLIVTHHPLPFRAARRLTSDTLEGRLLLDLIRAGVAIYSPHTAFDSAHQGINQRLAAGLQLAEVRPLVPVEPPLPGEPLGSGRRGHLAAPLPLDQFAERVKSFLSIGRVQLVGRADQPVEHVAVACGAAGELLTAAQQAGCDCLVLGETNFHTSLAAEASGVALVLTGHFASERFAVVELAGVLAAEFADLDIWASQREQDPLRWA